MKTEFQAGDRVAWYGAYGRQVGTVASWEPDGFGLIRVYGEADTFLVHPKQCRRLVKKQPRRITIQFHVSRHPTFTYTLNDFEDGETVEFVEVRRK